MTPVETGTCYWLATYFRSYKSRPRSSQIVKTLSKSLVENEEQFLKDLQRVLRTQKVLKSARWVLVTHPPLCCSLICQTPKGKTNANQLKEKVNDYAKMNKTYWVIIKCLDTNVTLYIKNDGGKWFRRLHTDQRDLLYLNPMEKLLEVIKVYAGMSLANSWWLWQLM